MYGMADVCAHVFIDYCARCIIRLEISYHTIPLSLSIIYIYITPDSRRFDLCEASGSSFPRLLAVWFWLHVGVLISIEIKIGYQNACRSIEIRRISDRRPVHPMYRRSKWIERQR